MDQQRGIDAFRTRRRRQQARVLETEHLGIKRFFRLDSDAYADRTNKGGLDAPTKELLGLVASAVLRCDDCVAYHLERAVKAGYREEQIEDALNVALVVGGSIVIPHLRRAYETMDELIAERDGAAKEPPRGSSGGSERFEV